MKSPNPSSFDVRGVVDKKVVAKKPNRVSAKCAISNIQDPSKKLACAFVVCDPVRAKRPRFAAPCVALRMFF
jgi:hypothetical protein